MNVNCRTIVVFLALAVLLSIPAFAAKKSTALLFGPTGVQVTLSKKMIHVTGVQKGSPAEGKLKKGDQITGLDSKKFAADPKRDISYAIDKAETKASAGKMTLMIKGGKTVILNLSVLGSYSPTAPYNCAKSDKIISQAAEHILKTGFGENGSRLHPELLGLMATGEKKYIDAATKEILKSNWAKPDPEEIKLMLSGEKPQRSTGWYWGYHLITLSEYHLLSDDKSVLPAIRIYAVALAKGHRKGHS